MTNEERAKLVERLRDERNPRLLAYRKLAADQIEADGQRIAELERDRAALAKQLDIAERKLKGVTKLWHADRAALGDKQ